MCSICGGTRWDSLAQRVWEKSKDRGRDASGKIQVEGSWIGNHRAIPTTEVLEPKEKQPVGGNIKLVFNGIISNDTSLGILPGEADTSVLPRVLNFSSLEAFRDSILSKIVGSYAIAVLFPDGNIWLACNYRPIWILEKQDQKYFSSLSNHFPSGSKPWKIRPYSVMDLQSGQSLEIHRTQQEKALVICSSGLDSTTVAAYACHLHGPDRVTLLHFNYGCWATSRETEKVSQIAKFLKCSHIIQEMPSFGGSSLLKTDEKEIIAPGISGAEYAHEWVPARNLVMLSLATALAEAQGYGYLYLGSNLEEAGAYPDNEEQFLLDFNSLLYGAVQNGVKIELRTPLGGLMKHEIIPFGTRYNTPYHLTWSCYRGGNLHCGNCGPCFMRKTAFERNGMVDPVEYQQ
jgi:7-cyano-7-deazaguanine synthase